MHDSAYRIGELVMRTYCDLPNAKILEVGSLNVNGCLRDAATPTTDYVGLDLEEGPSVDFVITPGTPFPVEDDTFDLVMASSVFEHDSRFWDTFVRMCRAARAGGHIYVNAPSNGTVHRYPVDCWRFYPDAGLALVEYARSEKLEIDLVESFIGNRHCDVWNDFAAVFRKGPSPDPLNTSFVYQRYPTRNARTWQSRVVYNKSERTEDMELIDGLRQQRDSLSQQNTELEQLRAALAEEQQQRGALAEQVATLLAASGETEQHHKQASQDNAYLIEQVSNLENILRERQDEIDYTRARAEELIAERDQVASKIAELDEIQEALAGERQQRTTLAEEVSKLSAALVDTQQQRDSLSQRSAELDRVHAAFVEQQAQCSDLSQEVATLSAAFNEVEQQRTQASVENAELVGQVASLESNLRQRQEEIKQAWANAEGLAAERDRLNDKSIELEGVRERLEAKLTEANGWVFDLAGERRTLEERLAEVQANLKQAKRSITRLQAVALVKQHQLNTHGTANRQLLSGVARLQGLDLSPEVLHSQTEQLLAEWCFAEHPLAHIAGVLHSAASSMSTLAEQKGALHRNLKSMTERLEERERATRDTQGQIVHLTDTVATLTSDMLAHQVKAAQALEQKGALHHDVVLLVARLEDRERAANDTEGRVSKLSETVASLRSEALSYHAKAAEALEQLSKLRAEHQQQTRALQALEDRSGRKDRDLSWLRRFYQLLETSEAGWSAMLPPQVRKHRMAQILKSDGLFDADAYLRRYPDVTESGMNALRHYLLHGMAEGRFIADHG